MKSLNKAAILGVDIDGVLANQIHDIIPLIKQRYGISLEYADVTKWNLPVGPTNIAEIIMSEQENRDYILNMPLHDKAKEVMDLLSVKYDIAIVTARKPSIKEWCREWLINNKIPHDELDCTAEGEKHLSKLGLAILIDDYIGNVKKFLEGCNGKSILFSQPWNQELALVQCHIDNQRLLLVRNWLEMENAIEKLLQVTADKTSSF